jgi:hypothetical protein
VRKIRYEWFGTCIQIQMLIMKVSRMIMHKLTHWYHHLSWSDGQHPFMFRSSCQNTIFTWIYDREFYPKYIIWKMWVPLIVHKVMHILWIGSTRLSWLGEWKKKFSIELYIIWYFWWCAICQYELDMLWETTSQRELLHRRKCQQCCICHISRPIKCIVIFRKK